jgi:transcriptional regulator with XRE-family HTH domain
LAAGALLIGQRSRTISAVPEFPFRERLSREFKARREKNARYSLRAFAAFLATDHSTLSQILRGKRPIPESRIRRWSGKLGLDKEEIAVYLAAEKMPDEVTSARQERLRHWTADAMGVVTERVHWQILQLSRTPGFRADCRWIAGRTGASVDQVNLALATLLRLRLLETTPAGEWKDATGLPQLTEREFRRIALARIRESTGRHP